MPFLPKLPRTIGQGVLWISAAAVFASWAGWLEPPGAAQERARQQQFAAESRAAQAERAIAILQYQQTVTNSELTRVNNKLEEMSMVLYSMERRSR